MSVIKYHKQTQCKPNRLRVDGKYSKARGRYTFKNHDTAHFSCNCKTSLSRTNTKRLLYATWVMYTHSVFEFQRKEGTCKDIVLTSLASPRLELVARSTAICK